MSRFRATFPQLHTVLPIVHVVGREQALRNLTVAREAGADGAFLLSHGRVGDDELLALQAALSAAAPRFWLGVNCLGLSVEEVFRRVGPQADRRSEARKRMTKLSFRAEGA